MYIFYIIFVALVEISPLFAADAKKGQYTNISFNRRIDLPTGNGSLLIREIYDITARCNLSECSSYDLQFSESWPNVVWMDGALVEGSEKPNKNDLVKVQVVLVVDGALRPDPKVLPQGRMMWVRLNAPLLPPSAYTTEKGSLTINLCGAQRQLADSIGPGGYSASTPQNVIYDNVMNLNPDQPDEVTLRAICKDPGLRILKWDKVVKIGEWSGLARTSETVRVRNDAASIDGDYSPVVHDLIPAMGRSSLFRGSFPIHLPPNHSSSYAKDVNGLMWTTKQHENTLYVVPRYPIYGGWKYQWEHGFDVPIGDMIKIDRGRYRLEVVLVDTWDKQGGPVMLDKYDLKIILPEGARNLQVENQASDFDSASEFLTYSLFDFVGRPTIHLRRSDLVIHGQLGDSQSKIVITYELPRWAMFIKPVVISWAVLVLLAVSAIGARLDLGLSLARADEKTTVLAALLERSPTDLDRKFVGDDRILEELNKCRRGDVTAEEFWSFYRALASVGSIVT